MRCTARERAAVSFLAFAVSAVGASPGAAQTHLTSVEELRRALAAGDQVAIVSAAAPRLAGRLTRVGDVDFDIRIRDDGRMFREMTIRFDAVQSLERPRDPLRNGTVIGAGIGAGLGGVLFTYAAIVDRNEIDEWAPIYARATAISTVIGALIGRAVDAARSKPPITFVSAAERRTRITVQPRYSRRRVSLAVSFSP